MCDYDIIVDEEAHTRVVTSIIGNDDGYDTIHINATTMDTSLVVIGGGARDVLSTNGNDGTLSLLIGDYASLTIDTTNHDDDVRNQLVHIDSTYINEQIGDRDYLSSITPINGRTVVIGGSDNDHITIDTSFGDITICGDHCSGTFNSSILLTSMVTLTDGNDQAMINGISSLVFGIGSNGNDDITVRDSSYNVLIGDHGSLNVMISPIVTAQYVYTSDSNAIGDGNDVLSISTSDINTRSIVLGGDASDIMTVNGGSCTILCGDDCSWSANGQFITTSLSLSSFGGNDHISFNGSVIGLSTSLIIGGSFADTIDTNSSHTIALTDSGTISYDIKSSEQPECWLNGATVIALSTNDDGRDSLSMNIEPFITESGTLIGIGGGNEDHMSSAGGVLSVLIGDYGTIVTEQPLSSLNMITNEISKLSSVTSTFESNSIVSPDYLSSITVSNGRTIVIGGSGNDDITIDTSFGDITVCGDHCSSSFINVGHLQLTSTNPNGNGNDSIRINGLSSNVFGLGGANDDQLLVYDSLLSVLIGDHGSLVTSSVDGEFTRDLTVLLSVQTSDTNDIVGNDQLSAVSSKNVARSSVRNVLFGGAANDIITSDGQCTIQCGDDCSLSSHNGQRLLTSNVNEYNNNGGNDRLSFTSVKNLFATSIMIGGSYDDMIRSIGATIGVIGDDGTITYESSLLLSFDSLTSNICWGTSSLLSVPSILDGSDIIDIIGTSNTSEAMSVAAAAIGGDGIKDKVTIEGTSLTSVIGDYGTITIEHVDLAISSQRIVSTITDVNAVVSGGVDHIQLTCSPSVASLASRSVIFGGAADDMIDTHDCTCAIVCGDHCILDDTTNTNSDGATRTLSSFIVPLPASGMDTIRYTTGRSNTNNKNDGTLIAIGGVFGDSFNVHTGTTTSLLMGDVGTISFTDVLIGHQCYALTSVVSQSSLLSNPTDNHNDAFIIDGRATISIGGIGNDSFIVLPSSIGTIGYSSLSATASILCGDDCSMMLSLPTIIDGSSRLHTIESLPLASGNNNNDMIDMRESMNSVIIGGNGNDNITSGRGDDFICGDHCHVTFDTRDSSSTCQRSLSIPQMISSAVSSSLISIWPIATMKSTSVLDIKNGNNDMIIGGAGHDLIIGGQGGDTLYGNDGSDIIFGDAASWISATIDYTIAGSLNQTYSSIDIPSSLIDMNDVINGGNDDDYLIGGHGNDMIIGGDGNDDIIGGHNINNGYNDGNDHVYGGNGDDVIVGDNGAIIRTAVSLPTCASWPLSSINDWLQYNGNAGVIREVFTYDITDMIGGNDRLYGDNGDDRLFGQRGADTIYGDNGDDEIIGGQGDDTITGGNGNDLLIGDVAHTRKQRLSSSNNVNSADNRWSYQLLLEEIGTVICTAALTPTRASSLGWATNGDFFVSGDQYIIGGLIHADNSKVYVNGSSASWEAHVLSVTLEDGGNDVMDGGDGDDVMIGQRGDDTLSGGYGNDILIGDGIHLPSAAIANSMIPTAITATRIIAQSNVFGAGNLTLGLDTLVGSLIVPAMMMLPREVEFPITQVESVGGWNHRALEWFEDHIDGFTPLSVHYQWSSPATEPRDITYFRALSSYGGTVMHHPFAIYGNNKLQGDSGNDTLVGGNVWAMAPTFIQSSLMDDARNRALSFAESANTRMTLLAHQLDQWRRLAVWRNATTCPANKIKIASDSLNGGSDTDTLVGDDLLLTTIAPVFSNSATGSSNDTAIIDTYHMLRDIELVSMYLDATLFLAQQTVVASLDSLLTKYWMWNSQVLPCEYATINIGSDTLRQGDGSGIIVGNYLILASSIAHPNTIVDPASLTAANHQRNVDFSFAYAWLASLVPVRSSTTADVPQSYIDKIQCYNDERWTFAADSFFGSCDVLPDLVVANVAIFGAFLKSTVPLPNGYNGGHMLQAIEEALIRTIDAISPSSSSKIDDMSVYSYNYYATAPCQSSPSFVESVNDVGSKGGDSYYTRLSQTYDSVSTAITFDGNTAASSSGGLSALPLLSFDAISSDNSWYNWFGVGWWLGSNLGSGTRSALNHLLAPQIASMSWLWATSANASLAATRQPAAIDISRITSGTIIRTYTHTYAHMHTYIDTHTHTHTHIHTYTHIYRIYIEYVYVFTYIDTYIDP
jgi:Ca2+-binding RTX toxin-like protein